LDGVEDLATFSTICKLIEDLDPCIPSDNLTPVVEAQLGGIAFIMLFKCNPMPGGLETVTETIFALLEVVFNFT
jgi:hypothetical protein